MMIHEAIKICLNNNVKVYPINKGNKFKIVVEQNGNKVIFKKLISSKEVNEAMTKTYIHYANKLI